LENEVKVKEIIEQLQALPPNMDVLFWNDDEEVWEEKTYWTPSVERFTKSAWEEGEEEVFYMDNNGRIKCLVL